MYCLWDIFGVSSMHDILKSCSLIFHGTMNLPIPLPSIMLYTPVEPAIRKGLNQCSQMTTPAQRCMCSLWLKQEYALMRLDTDRNLVDLGQAC